MKQNTTKVGADGKSLQVGQCTAGVRQRINWEYLEKALKRLPGSLEKNEKIVGVEVDAYGITITIE